jgi:nicotinamidase-related amidase
MKALLIVDMLNDFVEDWGALKVKGAKEIIPYINALKEKFGKEGDPVIYICDSHDKNDPEFKIWPAHCVEGTKGAEIINELKPDKKDYVIKKKTYSGFFGTNLKELLDELKVDTVYITGVAMNICVHYTAADARMNGFKVIVPLRGVKGLTEEDEDYMRKQFKNILNVKLIIG